MRVLWIMSSQHFWRIGVELQALTNSPGKSLSNPVPLNHKRQVSIWNQKLNDANISKPWEGGQPGQNQDLIQGLAGLCGWLSRPAVARPLGSTVCFRNCLSGWQVCRTARWNWEVTWGAPLSRVTISDIEEARSAHRFAFHPDKNLSAGPNPNYWTRRVSGVCFSPSKFFCCILLFFLPGC